MTSGLAACALIRIGREVGCAEWRQRGAHLRTSELFQARFKTLLQRVAEGIVGGDEVPLLAELIEQQLGDGVGLHPRRIADAKNIPVTIASRHRVGVAAGDDVQHLGLVRYLTDRERHRGIDVAEKEVDLVALDQLVGLLHRRTGVGAGRVLGYERDLSAEDAALGVDLLDRQFASYLLVLAELGVGACERIVEAELDGLIRPAL